MIVHSLHMNGVEVTDPSLIDEEFYRFYYENTYISRINLNITQYGPIITDHYRSLLNLFFTAYKIKNAMWSIFDDKAPCSDGYNNKFYKTTWSIVGEDIVHAISQFFENRKMLQSWNTTTITFIPRWNAHLTQVVIAQFLVVMFYIIAFPNSSVLD